MYRKTINVVKTIINHPRFHHKWVVETLKHGVVYDCFNMFTATLTLRRV